jgi:hypothetical protein
VLSASVLVVVALGGVGGVGAARADDVESARARFEEARAAFRAGHYAEAAEAYERSAAAQPHPAPLVNAAEAWEVDGNRVRAAQACDKALTLDLDANLRTSIEARLARLSRSIGTLLVQGPSDVGVRVDGGEVYRMPARIRLSTGRHRLSYVNQQADGPTLSQETDLLFAAGEERTIVFSRASIAAPSNASPSRDSAAGAPRPGARGGGPPIATWISFGVGGASGVATAIFGLLTVAARNDYEAMPTRTTLDDFHHDRLATNIALGVSVAAVAVGVVVWIVQGQPAQPGSAASRALDPIPPMLR